MSGSAGTASASPKAVVANTIAANTVDLEALLEGGLLLSVTMMPFLYYG
jgi:hypothetical protein